MNKRVLAFFADYIIAAFLMNIPFVILVMIPLISGNGVNAVFVRTLISMIVPLLYLVLRDVPLMCSIGKRIFSLRVIDVHTEKDAALAQKIIRNITMFLGPFEILFFLIFKKRLGDIIARTTVCVFLKT